MEDRVAPDPLLTLSPVYRGLARSLAVTIDKIMRGARAGDLPIQLPSKFALFISLKTAKAIGLEIPQSLLLRADRVIQ